MFIQLRDKKTTAGRTKRAVPAVTVCRKGGRLATQLVVPNDLLAEIGMKPGDKVGLAVGIDEDDGWVAMVPGNDSTILPRAGSKRTAVVWSERLPATSPHGARDAQYKVVKKHRALLIELPRLEAAE